jgi:hypothetical protein
MQMGDTAPSQVRHNGTLAECTANRYRVNALP